MTEIEASRSCRICIHFSKSMEWEHGARVVCLQKDARCTSGSNMSNGDMEKIGRRCAHYISRIGMDTRQINMARRRDRE